MILKPETKDLDPIGNIEAKGKQSSPEIE